MCWENILFFVKNIKILEHLKNFLFRSHVVTDRPFRYTTKYTVFLITLFYIVVLNANNFDCDDKLHKFEKMNKYEQNDHCEKSGTFLVLKALQENMKSNVQYPGVYPHNKAKDEVVRQQHYRQINVITAILIGIAAAPYFIWKVEGARKINDILDQTNIKDKAEYFVACAGSNGEFAVVYSVTKILAMFVPVSQWFYLSAYFGKRFRTYGIDVACTLFTEMWPHPADVLFPKYALCEVRRYVGSGHVELTSLLCNIEVNYVLRWSMLFFWMWITIIFVVNVIHPIYISFLYCKSEGLEFGDWLMLWFVSMNLKANDLKEFRNILVEHKPNFFVNSQASSVS